MQEGPAAVDEQQLGPIELSGFRDMDAASMIVLKKIVGNYARKFSDQVPGFEKLRVTMKSVHASTNPIFELHCKLLSNGKTVASQFEDRNLFFALDRALKRVESEVK